MAAALPQYAMIKRKLRVPREKMKKVESKLAAGFRGHKINRADGLRVDFKNSWLHLRQSNTEPIVRIYTEAPTYRKAMTLYRETARLVRSIVTGDK
jgi:phosphomannomutase